MPEEDVKRVKEYGSNCELEMVKWEHTLSEKDINIDKLEHFHSHNLWLEIDKAESDECISSVAFLLLVNAKYLVTSFSRIPAQDLRLTLSFLSTRASNTTQLFWMATQPCYSHCNKMCFVWLISNKHAACYINAQTPAFICARNIFMFRSHFTSFFFPQWRSPGCMGAALWLDWCRITWSHWKCLCHFKSLPCLSGWHHCLRTHYITPSQALSLKDSTTLCLLSHKHIHANMHRQRPASILQMWHQDERAYSQQSLWHCILCICWRMDANLIMNLW